MCEGIGTAVSNAVLQASKAHPEVLGKPELQKCMVSGTQRVCKPASAEAIAALNVCKWHISICSGADTLAALMPMSQSFSCLILQHATQQRHRTAADHTLPGKVTCCS